MDAAVLAGTSDADLVWDRGAALAPGDRVRHEGKRGSVGFRNDDGAPFSPALPLHSAPLTLLLHPLAVLLGLSPPGLLHPP